MLIFRSVILNEIKNRIPHIRTINTESQTIKQDWDILCGICVERKPIITRPLTKLETDFQKMLNEIEIENSKRSDHEIRREADKRRADEFKKGQISVDDMDKAIGETAAEFEDRAKKELLAFKPASRITEADKKNDTRSTERKLDKHLMLIVKETLGMKDIWLVPQDTLKNGETLRTAAERILREKCGMNVKAKFYGNAPCGYYKYKYPKPVKEQKDSIGAKIFFMKAQYLSGTIDQKNITDFNWATREELKANFQNEYHYSIQNFLIDDENFDEKEMTNNIY